MKILFWGEARGDTGPENVNKTIYKNLTNSFYCIKSRRKLGKIAEGIRKSLQSDVTVVSGISPIGCLLAFFSKRMVYLLHGCAAREAEADGLDVKAAICQERYLMEKADLLLCVSETFRDWIRTAYPQYAHKTDYLHPGVECRRVTAAKIPGSVIAAGGDSAIKNNAVLARAVENLNSAAQLEIYGKVGDYSPALSCTRYAGRVSHEEFLQKLAQSEIFVLNSRFETFSLTVIEALYCGCSVLVSEKAGVTEVLELGEEDVIRDPENPEEIREKLECLLKKPNNKRILQSLDREALSGKACVRKLEEKCARLLKRGRTDETVSGTGGNL